MKLGCDCFGGNETGADGCIEKLPNESEGLSVLLTGIFDDHTHLSSDKS